MIGYIVGVGDCAWNSGLVVRRLVGRGELEWLGDGLALRLSSPSLSYERVVFMCPLHEDAVTPPVVYEIVGESQLVTCSALAIKAELAPLKTRPSRKLV